MKQKVISREYKVMLKEERFGGSREMLLKSAAAFWNEFRTAIADVVPDSDGALEKVDKDRVIRFYDSSEVRLRESHYVIRERIDRSSGEREITLKFRHPDRYLSQDRNMEAADIDGGRTKFEEDIKFALVTPDCVTTEPTVATLYSYSTKQDIATSLRLNTVNALGELYPGLRADLLTLKAGEPIVVVGRNGGFAARELVIVGDRKTADFQIGDEPDVEAECALVVWYEVGGDSQQPVAVEFSFRYGDEGEDYDGVAAGRALDVFRLLPQRLPQWVNVEGLTKTAFVYSRV